MKWVLSTYCNTTNNLTVVDYGCGNSPYKPLFEPFVDQYIACDFPGNRCADCELNELGGIPLDDCVVDIVLSSQVLEHVPTPHGYLNEAYRVLRPGGRLILSTHGVWRFHPDPGDYHRWTSAGLRRELESAGFAVDKILGILGPHATALQLWQDAVSERVPYRLRHMFFLLCQWRIKKADSRYTEEERAIDACIYVAVARRMKRSL